jgi:CDP-glycerol glycerophosphotransferase (TagB/SpsB family)
MINRELIRIKVVQLTYAYYQNGSKNIDTAEKELMSRLQEKYPESELFHWNRDADNFDVLSRSDIMISDFSGVIYDYAFIFERPVIYAGAAPDTSTQDEYWLDEPYWGIQVLPRFGKELKEEDIPNLSHIITELLSSDRFAASIHNEREKYWQNIGGAAKAVTDYLIAKAKEVKLDGK